PGGVETITTTSTGCPPAPPVTISVLGTLPIGVVASAFTNSPCAPTCSATVTLSAAATSPASSTVLTIQAIAGSPAITQTATLTLVVQTRPHLTIAAPPSTLTITT